MADRLEAALEEAFARCEALEEELDGLLQRLAEANEAQEDAERELDLQQRQNEAFDEAIEEAEEALEQALDRREFSEHDLDRAHYKALLADASVREARAEADAARARLVPLQEALRQSRARVDEAEVRLELAQDPVHPLTLRRLKLQAALKAALRLGQSRSQALGSCERRVAALRQLSLEQGELDSLRREVLEDCAALARGIAERRARERQLAAELARREARLQEQLEKMLS